MEPDIATAMLFPSGDQAGAQGVLLGAGGVAITGYLGYVRLFGGQSIGGRPLLVLGMLMMFLGVQLVTLGLLAELQARTFHESQGKPIYAIRELLESRLPGDGGLPLSG